MEFYKEYQLNVKEKILTKLPEGHSYIHLKAQKHQNYDNLPRGTYTKTPLWSNYFKFQGSMKSEFKASDKHYNIDIVLWLSKIINTCGRKEAASEV